MSMLQLYASRLNKIHSSDLPFITICGEAAMLRVRVLGGVMRVGWDVYVFNAVSPKPLLTFTS